MLEWYRGEYAGDLKRSELNELVGDLTRLNALEGEIWKSDQKVVMDDKINPKIVMDEEWVQNDVMDEEFVKNFVIDAKIDSKVVMDLSITKVLDGTVCNPLIKILLEEIIDENEPWLLIGIPGRDPFLVTQQSKRHSESSDQHIKKLMSLREGLRVMMQCCMRQHLADRCWLHEHLGGRSSWKESTRMKFTKESTTYFVKGLVCRWNVQKMRSESSEYVRKTMGFFTNGWRIKIALESYFEEHAHEVWERSWMNPEMQTTLLNTYPPRLIATILKALREQLKENDQLNAVEEIAGLVPEILLEYDKILKGGGGFWDDVNGGYLPEDIVLAARREEIDRVHSEGVYEIVPMQECKEAGMKPLDLMWVETDKSVDPAHRRKFDRSCVCK